MENVERNPDGTLKAGSVLNPNGNGGAQMKGFAPWKVRVAQLDDRYETLQLLLDMFEEKDGKFRPGKELMKYHPRDVSILTQLLLSIFADDPLRYHEAFWNRMEGTPTETVRHEGGISYGLDAKSIDFIRELRSLKSGRSSETNQLVIDGKARADNAQR